tara:strand:- start:202 stop:402 length:201 start_codon:yes stop_codon:yes gene_type:complete
MNTTVNIWITHRYNKHPEEHNPFLVGVYTSKELADAAGKASLEMFAEDSMHWTVTIKALDDKITHA